MLRITVKRQSSYGIISSDYNVFSYGKQIGYCSANDVDSVLKGNLKLICPVSNWRNTFSVKLKNEIGLPISSHGYDDKGDDNTGKQQGQILSCFI